MNAGEVDEPIRESAPLARWIAERLCQVDPATGESCAWYHGFRQYLRVLGLAITPAHHAGFLKDAFGAAAPRGSRVRVLVSGAIDYSMFAHVLWACRSNGVTADVTVVDICDTPLFLNLWYARRVGVPVNTVRVSILTHEADGAYDFVCTNAFFGQFPPSQRPALMAQWRNLLKPGGQVITVTPFRPGSQAERVGFTPDEGRALHDAVLRAAQAQPGALDIPPDEVARRAESFAARMKVYPVRSLDEIRDLFEQGGFGLDHLSSPPAAPDSRGDLTGPTVSRSARYALVIATRK